MCHAVRCPTCGRATWEGCGLHVEEALAGFPASLRCQGHADEAERAGEIRAHVAGWFRG